MNFEFTYRKDISMIILEPMGGLCNRMRAMQSAINLAREYNTELKVIWVLNKALNCEFSKLFLPIPHVDVISTIANEKVELDGEMAISDNCYYNIRDAKELGEKLAKGEEVYVKTCFQFYECGNYTDFIPCPEVLRQVDMLLPKERINLVGVHIRRTDQVRSIAESPTESFVQCMEKEIANQPQTLFYLATDSWEEEETLKKLFGSRIIANDDRNLDRNSSEGIIDALTDLVCLSETQKLYGSYWSSFSDTAAVYRQNKEFIVVKITTYDK
jgi:hypothetical protein